MKSSMWIRSALVLLSLLAVVGCGSSTNGASTPPPEATEQIPPMAPPPPPPPPTAQTSPACGKAPAGKQTREVRVIVVDGKVVLAGREDRLFFNPETNDELSWSLSGAPDQSLLVTFDDPEKMRTVADSADPKKKRYLSPARGIANCEEFKYTVSIDPPGVAEPLDPVIIIRY